MCAVNERSLELSRDALFTAEIEAAVQNFSCFLAKAREYEPAVLK